MQKAYSERADLTRSGVSMLRQRYKHLYNICKLYVKFQCTQTLLLSFQGTKDNICYLCYVISTYGQNDKHDCQLTIINHRNFLWC